ncbi:antibiotic biosynthesis monooxygenase [Sphingomonas sp.]|uniref:antibiotic biosynthesis monooxygenase family protein n=1 Tax=Sphingomonas sp. TaxID=28214 RepID=UPI000DB4F9BC|nr:antibiotic biosynthesis monooxygenase [Sphingomonas sp.]PZU07094.1 MAG: antibiotic biosynthesis monooxygenase [Sphingomonas sp.]
MDETKRSGIAVIFRSLRNGLDEAGYAAAAKMMDEEARRQPGFLGIDSVRDTDGHGITISYWADEEAAIAWRNHAGHAAIRARGRAEWYENYEVIVAGVTRGYRWAR